MAAYCSKLRPEKTLGQRRLRRLEGAWRERASPLSAPYPGRTGTGWPSGSAEAAAESAAVAARRARRRSARPRNSRRCGPAILHVFARSAPCRPRGRRGRRQGLQTRRSDGNASRSHFPPAGQAVVSSFLRRSETHFASVAKRRPPRGRRDRLDRPPGTSASFGDKPLRSNSLARESRAATRKQRHELECPPLPDHRARRRRGRAHALEAPESPARDRRALDAGPCPWRGRARRARRHRGRRRAGS